MITSPLFQGYQEPDCFELVKLVLISVTVVGGYFVFNQEGTE